MIPPIKIDFYQPLQYVWCPGLWGLLKPFVSYQDGRSVPKAALSPSKTYLLSF